MSLAQRLQQQVAQAWRRVTAPETRPALLGYDRNVYLLLLYTLGKGLQLTIGALTINLYAYSLGYRSDFIGILTGMPSIGAFIAGIPTGLLADRIGRKPVLLFGALLTPLTLVATGLATDPISLLAAGLANGLLAGGYWITILPLMTESTREEQRVSALALNSFLLLGMGALGSLLGGAIPEAVGHLIGQPANTMIPLRWGVLGSGILSFLPSIGLFWLREPRRQHRTNETEAAEQIAESTENARRQIVWLFAALLIPDIIFVIAESSVVGLSQLYFRLRFAVPIGQLGTLFAVIGLIGGSASLLAPRIANRFGRFRTLLALQFFSVPIILIIGFSPLLLIAICAEFLRAAMRSVLDPVYNTFAMESVPSRWRATLSGGYGIAWGVGYSVGAAIAGFLQAHVGLSFPYVLGASSVLTSAVLLTMFFGRASPRPATG